MEEGVEPKNRDLQHRVIEQHVCFHLLIKPKFGGFFKFSQVLHSKTLCFIILYLELSINLIK